MIKIFCDNCKEISDNIAFFCEIQVKEKVSAVDSRTMNINSQIRSTLLHFCEKCYTTKIKINEKKEKNNKK